MSRPVESDRSLFWGVFVTLICGLLGLAQLVALAAYLASHS